MHIKRLLVLPIISSLLITGCIKQDNKKEEEKETPKQQVEIDKDVEYEVERSHDELNKLDVDKSNNSNKNIKVDKNTDVTPQKAMDIVSKYIKKNYQETEPKTYIVDMYSVDGQSYYYIYAYRIISVGGISKEESIGYYDVNMKDTKVTEYLICDPNYKINISEAKAIELAKKYMKQYTDYKAESFKILNIASDCGDTFYCIEAYGKDKNNHLVEVGYFEVHVETGVVRGDVYPPEMNIKNEEDIDDETLKEPQVPDEEIVDTENTEEPQIQ